MARNPAANSLCSRALVNITVRHPANRVAERSYIYDVVFGEFLGLSYTAIAEERHDVSVSSKEVPGTLTIADVLLQIPDENWLQPDSLPTLPLSKIEMAPELIETSDVTSQDVPVLYGKPLKTDRFLAVERHSIDVGIDLFGAIFFMLTRYEEASPAQLDQHDRFPASASLSVRANLIERPVVNEYAEILWACLKHLFPVLVRKQRKYSVALTHDVDRIFDTRGRSWLDVARNAVGDVTRRKDLILASTRIRSKFKSGQDDFRREPSNTFDFIMDCSENHNAHSSFFFIPHRGTDGLDGDYDIDTPWVRSLLRQIVARGHQLGLHGSYHSYRDSQQLAAEFSKLKKIAREEGATQDSWGGRQHYLRWKVPETWQGWSDAGLDFDSTLTFPEVCGFRSGTCWEYPVFNLQTRKSLALRERPLIVMETSLFSECYMNLTQQAAFHTIEKLSSICRQFDGQFTLLWHNDNLALQNQKHFYRDVLEVVS